MGYKPSAPHEDDVKHMMIHATFGDPLYKIRQSHTKAPTMLDHVKSPQKRM